MNNNFIISRTSEQQKLLTNIYHGLHTVLTGDIGIGKTTLLKQIEQHLPRVVFLASVSPFKSALLEILQVLHQNGDLHIASIQNIAYLPWEDLYKRLNRRNIKDLLDITTSNLHGKDYVIILDSLETATPSTEKRIETLMTYATVVGAANHIKPSLKKLWWRFEILDIPPLTSTESKHLLWTLVDEHTSPDAALFERSVLNQANGNPLAITQLAQKAQNGKQLSTEDIRELRHPAGEKKIDITPLFILLGALIVATRFIALGMNSTDLYIVAGVCGGFFLGLRYFLYRGRK